MDNMTNKKVIAIHQPNFLPWIGFFYKIINSDLFVFLDNVQFSKNSYTNRVKIKGPNGVVWLTVPIYQKFGQQINEVKINNNINWRKKHLRTLETFYKRSKYFSEIIDIIEAEYYRKDWEYLVDLNVNLINAISDYLNIEKNFIFSSQLNVEGRSTHLLIKIIKKLNGTHYLSGLGGKKYQDEGLFKKNNIKILYSNYRIQAYPQLWDEFVEGLSILDLLFNTGKKAIDYIKGGIKQ